MPPPSPFERKQMLMQDLPLVASPTSLETHIYIYILSAISSKYDSSPPVLLWHPANG